VGRFLAAAVVILCAAAFSAVGGAPSRKLPKEIKSRLDALAPQDQIAYLRSLRGEAPRAVVDFYLGNAFLALGASDSAAAFYGEAVAADSAYGKAHVNLGIALENLRRHDQARLHYEKAIAVDSTDVLAYCHLGHYHHAKGELGEAVSLYQRAVAIDPKSAQAHYNLGLAFADTRIFAEAVREWRRVMELKPDEEIGRTSAENVRLIETYLQSDSLPPGENLRRSR